MHLHFQEAMDRVDEIIQVIFEIATLYSGTPYARIVSAERLALFCVTRSVPPEKALSIGTLVAGMAR
jgi:hypothetical protein